MAMKLWMSAYEDGRKALEPGIARIAAFLGGRYTRLSPQASGRADYLMAFAVRFVRRMYSGNPSAAAPTVSSLTRGEQKACQIIFETLDARLGDEIDLMTDHPRVAHEIYGLYKFRNVGDLAREVLDDTCQAKLDAGSFDQIENPLSCAVLIMKAFAESEAHATGAPSGPKNIETTDPKFIEWQSESPDPDLWHQMLPELNYDIPENVDLLYWIVRQPGCDRATAAGIFLMLYGQAIVGMPKDKSSAQFPGSLILDICERANSQGFARQELSLASIGYANDQRPLLNEMRRLFEERSIHSDENVPVPVGLFKDVLSGRPPQSRYTAHSEQVVSLDG